MIKLGDKPLAEMSAEEMLEAITAMRTEREALRAEAIKKKQDAEAGPVARQPRAPKAPKITTPNALTDTLAFLKGGNDA